MRALVVAHRQPDPRGTGDAKMADKVVDALTRHGAAVRVEHGRAPPAGERARELVRALATGAPLQLGLTASAEFARRVETACDSGDVDVIVAVHARAAGYVPARHRPRTLALILDSYGLNYATYHGLLPLPLDLVYRSEARRMARLEAAIVREFGAVGLVAPADAAALGAAAGGTGWIVHLPDAVDTDYFDVRPAPLPRACPRLVFTGRLCYTPNADAAVSLLSDIWPAVRRRWPVAELRLVGARPGRRLLRLAARAGARVHADVADIREHLAEATAALAPMRMGGGVQAKVLEAMAMGVPVICSPFANRGIGAAADDEVLLAATPEQYVRQLERILADPVAAARRSAAGRRLVRTRFAPELFRDRLLSVCELLAERRTALVE